MFYLFINLTQFEYSFIFFVNDNKPELMINFGRLTNGTSFRRLQIMKTASLKRGTISSKTSLLDRIYIGQSQIKE